VSDTTICRTAHQRAAASRRLRQAIAAAANRYRIEQLEPRLFAGGMVTVIDAASVLLASPGIDADAENGPVFPPSDGFVPTWSADVDEDGNWTFHPDPLPSDIDDILSPDADPLSDVGDESFVSGNKQTGGGYGALGPVGGGGGGMMTSSFGVVTTISVNPCTVSASEWTPLTPGGFNVYVSSCGCGTMPSSITINFCTAGTASKTASNQDYTGALTGTQFTISPLCSGGGSAWVPFWAVDDVLAEPTESLQLTLLGGETDIENSVGVDSGYSMATAYIGDNEPTVSVAATRSVTEGDGQALQFTVSKSSGTLATSVTVPYLLTGSATAVDDYISPSPQSVTIGAGQSSATVDIAVVDDAPDEVAELVTLTLQPGTSYFLSSSARSASATISDNDVEWAAGDAITGTIYPDDPDFAVSINSTTTFTLSATDRDQIKDNGVWSDYYDDVTSGESANDYHVFWEASEGEFTDPYGTTATYLAPDYVAGTNVRLVTLTATVDDVNRGNDAMGFNDQAKQVQKPQKVWQITLTVNQGPPDGTISGDNDTEAVPAELGGGKVGWISPNNPAGSQHFGIGTEIKGTLPDGVPIQQAYISQNKRGTKKHQAAGQWVVDYNSPNLQRDIYPADGAYRDADARHPNGPGNPDVRHIYLYDAPGNTTGPNNDVNIQAGWTDIVVDMTYQDAVFVNGTTIKLSNTVTWSYSHTLHAQGGQWVAVAHNP
jgi:hypothetical protein